MAKWMKQLAVGTIGLLATTSFAGADPLDVKHVPADSKWVIHLDMDSARKSAAWQPIYDQLQRNDDFETKVGQLETIFNAHFPDDLHDVTVSGATFGDNTGVVLVHANVDRAQVEQGLANNPGYASETHGDHSILTWTDNGKTNYGAFYSDTQFIVSQDKSRVATELDTLDGKSASLKPDATLAQGLSNQGSLMLYISGEDLAQLRRVQAAKSPLIAQMKSGWIQLQQDKNNVSLKVGVEAQNAETASRMKSAAEGMRSAVSLAAGEPDAKPGVKLLADVITNATASVDGSLVTVQLQVADKDLPGLIDRVVALKGGQKNP